MRSPGAWIRTFWCGRRILLLRLGPVAHDVSTLANHVSTAFCSILQGRARCLNFRELFDVSLNVSFRDKFSGCSHPSIYRVSTFRNSAPRRAACTESDHVSDMCPSRIHPRLFHQFLCMVRIDTPKLDQIPIRVATTSEQDSSILISEGPPPFSGKELPAVTFDVDHVYVLSRPRWTRCMSRTAAAPKWQLSGT